MTETDRAVEAETVKRALGQAGWCRNNGWTQQAYLLEELVAEIERLHRLSASADEAWEHAKQCRDEYATYRIKAEAEVTRLREAIADIENVADSFCDEKDGDWVASQIRIRASAALDTGEKP